MSDKQFFNISGRLVQGDVFDPQTTDMQGRPMVDLRGNPKVQYFIGVAVAKNAPDFNEAWAAINAIAARDWPTGEHTRAGFSWKVVDGDAPEHAQKEGFPGHWLFRFTSGFKWQAVAANAERPILDSAEIRRGYYVRVFFTVAGNKNTQKPGVYLNASVVELRGYGPEITSGPDAGSLINAAGGGHVPAGMQTTPVGGAPAAPAMQPAPAAPAMQPAPTVIAPHPNIMNPAAPAMQPAPAASAAPAVIAPHPNIMNPAAPAAPAAPAMQPAPAAPAAPAMQPAPAAPAAPAMQPAPAAPAAPAMQPAPGYPAV